MLEFDLNIVSAPVLSLVCFPDCVHVFRGHPFVNNLNQSINNLLHFCRVAKSCRLSCFLVYYASCFLPPVWNINNDSQIYPNADFTHLHPSVLGSTLFMIRKCEKILLSKKEVEERCHKSFCTVINQPDNKNPLGVEAKSLCEAL